MGATAARHGVKHSWRSARGQSSTKGRTRGHAAGTFPGRTFPGAAVQGGAHAGAARMADRPGWADDRPGWATGPDGPAYSGTMPM